jgi:hypothetical protein
MKFGRALAVALSLALLASTPAVSAVKSGATCKKIGQKSVFKGKTFTCIKSGKKLIWNKGVPIKSAAPIPSPTPAPTFAPTPSITYSSDSAYRNISDCKLQDFAGNPNVKVAFPMSPFRVKTTDPIDVLIFPIDFPDLTSNSNPQIDFKYIVDGVNQYYEAMSENRIEMRWKIHPNYVRFPEKVSELRLGGRQADGYWPFSSKAFELAKKTLDVSDFEILIYAPPLSTTREQIAVGPAFIANSINDKNATMLDGQSYEVDKFGFTTAHEIGHLLGIADLYNFYAANEAAAGGIKDAFILQFKYMGIFDLMNYAGGDAVELTSWNRWITELIGDSQIRCLPSSETTTFLTAVEVNGGIKGAVIPISRTEVIVLESRRALRFDSRLGKSNDGVLVYKIDSSIQNGAGPSRVIRKTGSTDAMFRDALLKNQDELIVDGYKIKVVSSSTTGDAVVVVRNP